MPRAPSGGVEAWLSRGGRMIGHNLVACPLTTYHSHDSTDVELKRRCDGPHRRLKQRDHPPSLYKVMQVASSGTKLPQKVWNGTVRYKAASECSGRCRSTTICAGRPSSAERHRRVQSHPRMLGMVSLGANPYRSTIVRAQRHRPTA